MCFKGKGNIAVDMSKQRQWVFSIYKHLPAGLAAVMLATNVANSDVSH